MEKPWHIYLMALFYMLAGINHFRKPELYRKVIPPFLPYKHQINDLVGFLLAIFGFYIFIPVFTEFALWSLIVLLGVIFPSNIYMALSKEASLGIPRWILILRLPLQVALIYWAYIYLPYSKFY